MTDDTLLGAGEHTSEGHNCERCANDGFVGCAIARQGWPDAGQRCAAFVLDYFRWLRQREAENDEAQR